MTSVVINQDLDSSVVKALRLLHSSDSDSENQLRQLWRQSVYEKYGNSRVPTSVLHKIKIPTLKREHTQIIDVDLTTKYKKSKLESESGTFQKAATSSVYSFDGIEIDISSNSEEDDDVNESPFEILGGEGVCTKCKTSFSSTNNKLVECVDCQKYYHQACHFPPITEMDLSDPRFVWYCSACEETISSTTNANDKIKNSDMSSPSKCSSPTKSSLSSKTSRSFGTTYGIKTSSSVSNNKLSSDLSSKHSTSSSNTKDRKYGLLKQHGTKKHEKKKSSK